MTAEHQTHTKPATATAEASALKRWLPLGLILAAMALIYVMGWHKLLTFENLALQRDALRTFVSANTLLALVIFMVTYIAVVAL